MSTTSPTLGRPADRTRLILQELRQQILLGQLEPGMRLPTRVEIEQRYGAGTATVQRALEQLRRDGYDRVNGKQGTYVVPNPPHLTRYAIIFADAPGTREWSRFFSALNDEAVRLEEAQARPEELHLPIFYSVSSRARTADYERLVQDIEEHRVSGLIFTFNPFIVENTPLLQQPGLPRVAIMSGEGASEIPWVSPDGVSFQERALAYLAAQGRRRVAIISAPIKPHQQAEWKSRIASHGLRTKPYWMQFVSRTAAEGAENCAHLLMHADQGERPDALIIADDNLVAHAVEGLLAAGVRVPEDVEVAAHNNFPGPVPSRLPVRNLGFDAREVMSACIAVIDSQRNHQPLPEKRKVAALFEEEVPAG